MTRDARPAEPGWLSRLVLDAVHLDQLKEHGGLPGVGEENTLEAVLARPQHRWQYEPASDLAILAAAYGWGIVTSHPYRDGNKRIAFLAIVIFVGLNGHKFEAAQDDVVTTMLKAAAGQLIESEMADWVRSCLVPRS